MTIKRSKQETINAELMAKRDSLLEEIAGLEGRITADTATHQHIGVEIASSRKMLDALKSGADAHMKGFESELSAVREDIAEAKRESARITAEIEAGREELRRVQSDIGEAGEVLVRANNNIQDQIQRVNQYVETTEEARIALQDVLDLIANKQKDLDAVRELLKTNNETNEYFIKARDGVLALKQELDQRLDYLRAQYADYKQPW